MSLEEFHEINTLTPKGRRVNGIMSIAHRKMEKHEAAGGPLPPLPVISGDEVLEEKRGCQSCQGGVAQLVNDAQCFDCGVELTICWFCIGLGEHLQICHGCSVARTNRWYASPHDAEWLSKVIIHEKGRPLSDRECREVLYDIQEGKCTGCRQLFLLRNMTLDHIEPRSKGGRNDIDNFQLLCGACNSMKGTRSQEEFISQLIEEGIRHA